MVSRHKRVSRTSLTEGKQMNAATLACAPSGATWHGINWADVHRQVRRLQARIVKATQEGRHNKVKALQWILTHSFAAKLLAVKRVTENSGKRTPGTDGVRWRTPVQKLRAAKSLIRKGYKALPLRRVRGFLALGKPAVSGETDRGPDRGPGRALRWDSRSFH